MRVPGVLVLAGLCATASAQDGGYLPLSREVERPFAAALAAPSVTLHSAIRPYRMKDLRGMEADDSLRFRAPIPALDRWAGLRNGRRWRWGPLVDASGGFDAPASRSTHKFGAGLWMDADLSPHVGVHINGQLWDQAAPRYLDTLVAATQGFPGEGLATGGAYYDVNGHVSIDIPKYFNITVGRGRNAFGEGIRSMMLSDATMAYPFLRITTTAWRFRYVNLYTRMSDIRGAGGDPWAFQGKFTSSHYLSLNLHERINVGLFETIVWGRGDEPYERGFDFNYVHPVLFFRPVEFTIGSPDNALLGGALNVRLGKSTLLYTQVMLDELVVSEMRSGNGWYANKQSVQAGVVAREAFGQRGLSLRAEWNFVRPFMYTHSENRQNYAHAGQPLAHPYGSNLQEVIGHAVRERGRWLVALRGSMAWLGSDTGATSHGNNIFRPERDRPRDANGRLINYGYRTGMAGLLYLFHGELRAGWLLDPATATRLELSYLYRHRSGEREPVTVDHWIRFGIVCHFRQRQPEQEVRYVLQ
jgi:hypothetical protein